MTLPLFPTLVGQGWSTFKRPTWATSVATHSSGDEVRAAMMAYPTYEFELPFPDYLPDDTTADSDLKTLMGFVNQVQGQFGTFRFTDPTDSALVGQLLGVGNGVQTVFPFIRTMANWVEPVGYVELVAKVYVAGQPVQAGWSVTDSVTGHNLLTFAQPPVGEISADFVFSFLCRLLADQQEFENHAQSLWLMKSLKFKSVKRP
jgi:hypothetical protein